MIYARINSDGGIDIAPKIKNNPKLLQTILNDGFLPLEREEMPNQSESNTTDGYTPKYRQDGDRIIKYYVRASVEKLKELKIAEIMAYDSSSEVNSFTIDGDEIWIPLATRLGLVNQANSRNAVYEMQGVAEEERIMTIRNPDTGAAYTKTISEVLVGMAMLEVYAGNCYNATADHVAAVQQIESVEELDAYDITAGYPEKINL